MCVKNEQEDAIEFVAASVDEVELVAGDLDAAAEVPCSGPNRLASIHVIEAERAAAIRMRFRRDRQRASPDSASRVERDGAKKAAVVYTSPVGGHAKNCCSQRHRCVTVSAMNFPKFWAKGTHQQFTCWRWSDSSLAEAASLAQEAARRIAERFAAGDKLRHGYGYPDRPLREPVLREIKAPGGRGCRRHHAQFLWRSRAC